jgi:hypothetical protein
MTNCGFLRRLAVVSLAALALGAAVAQPAEAARCPDEALDRKFLPWLDLAYYKAAPNGGFENGSSAWSLRGAASVVSGNESFYVNDAGDRYSLSLPSGSSATTSATCITTLDGTIRLFVRNTGSLLSTLKVEVLYTDLLGTPRAQTIALVLGGSRWQPTLPIVTLANLLHPPLLTDGKVDVSFRFTPLGSLGGWRIDDVYVDPFKAR